MKKNLNWKRSPTDPRDRKFTSPLMGLVELPNAVTNKAHMSSVKDQGNLGCCVGEGSTAAVEYTHRQWGDLPTFDGSELFCYYNARTDKRNDTGAYIRDSIHKMATLGVATEKFWPFVASKFAKMPPANAYADAIKHKIAQYQRIDTLDQLLHALAQHEVVVGGFDCFENLYDDKKGVIPEGSGQIIGGHCVCFTGYNKKKRIVEFKNSWGTSWGDGGYGYLPFWFWENNHVDDCWVLVK